MTEIVKDVSAGEKKTISGMTLPIHRLQTEYKVIVLKRNLKYYNSLIDRACSCFKDRPTENKY